MVPPHLLEFARIFTLIPPPRFPLLPRCRTAPPTPLNPDFPPITEPRGNTPLPFDIPPYFPPIEEVTHQFPSTQQFQTSTRGFSPLASPCLLLTPPRLYGLFYPFSRPRQSPNGRRGPVLTSAPAIVTGSPLNRGAPPLVSQPFFLFLYHPLMVSSDPPSLCTRPQAVPPFNFGRPASWIMDEGVRRLSFIVNASYTAPSPATPSVRF